MVEVMSPKREINRAREKTPIRHLSPATRITNFEEVVLGFETLEQAQEEARRCLRCPKKPCVLGCPINNDIPDFIAAIEDGDLKKAYTILRQRTTLPGVCGRVCPQEKQCEGSCTRGKAGEPIDIGNLERFVADWAQTEGLETMGPSSEQNSLPATSTSAASAIAQSCASKNQNVQLDNTKQNGSSSVSNTPNVKKPLYKKKVAVIGAGPAGLGAADILLDAGISVDIYDARNYAGGVLTYGIPVFRLPRKVVEHTINELQSRGAQFRLGTKIDDTITIDVLLKQYDAVFLSNGAEISKSAGLLGEDLSGVYQALDFLEEIAFASAADCSKIVPKFKRKHVVVIGGGNVAMDVAGTAMRCGAASVTVTYRRSLEELPARAEEVKFNQEEGVKFKLLSSPYAVLGDDQQNVRSLLCQEVELGEPDESGRCTPVCKIGSEFEIPADIVILAIGSDNDTSILRDTNISYDARGHVQVDDNFRTSVDGLWAGGDTVSGPLTVVNAMRAGRIAAADICKVLDITPRSE